MATSKDTSEGESNPKGDEGGTHAFQKPPPISLLKKLLDQRYAESKQVLNKSPSAAAVTRPETRHHLVDLHGLTLFLRRATRCLQCYKTGTLSMMGNTSREQQPPCVTKITIKCHYCSFLLSQELKKPKPSLAVDSFKPPDSETRLLSNPKESPPSSSPSPSSSPVNNSLPLEEVWIQEEQNDKEPPVKKRRNSNDDPLNVIGDRNMTSTKHQGLKSPSKAPDSEAVFTRPGGTFLPPVDYPEPKTNVYWVPAERTKKPAQAPVTTEEKLFQKETNPDFSEAPWPPSLPAEAKKKNENSSTVKDTNPHSCRKEHFIKEQKQQEIPSSLPLSENENISSNNFLDLKKSVSSSSSNNFSDQMKPTRTTSSLSSTNPGFQRPSPTTAAFSHEKCLLPNSFITNIIEDFENVTNTTKQSYNKDNNSSMSFKNDKAMANGVASTLNHLSKESKDLETKNSITIENLNVSNINFQNSVPTSYSYSSPADKTNNLRDSRIITKLLNLTETLKSELMFRAKEIEKQTHETTQLRHSSPGSKEKDLLEKVKNSIKKEMDDSSSEDVVDKERNDNSSFLEETSFTGSSDFCLSKSYKADKDPELIIPDIYVKHAMNESESFFQNESEGDSEMKCSSEVRENFHTQQAHTSQRSSTTLPLNITESNFSVFESEESEMEGEEKDDVLTSYRFHDLSSESNSSSSALFSN